MKRHQIPITHNPAAVAAWREDADCHNPGPRQYHQPPTIVSQSSRLQYYMAGLDLEDLVPLIHHQLQAGSGFAACVRHVWNSLLQGNCFTPDDFSELTRNRQETRGQSGADIDHTGAVQNSVVESKPYSVPRIFMGKRAQCMGAEVCMPNCRTMRIPIVPTL
ncbi:hypothetical protein BDN67DRAFT_593455 [Paxillus ammoniavirescens]|nr:hypothetical protein BDN67DRAFT_593455 [Paxillus ammoniavirescens]